MKESFEQPIEIPGIEEDELSLEELPDEAQQLKALETQMRQLSGQLLLAERTNAKGEVEHAREQLEKINDEIMTLNGERILRARQIKDLEKALATLGKILQDITASVPAN